MSLVSTVLQFLSFGTYNASPPVMVAGTSGALQVDQSGQLRVVMRTDTPTTVSLTADPANNLQAKTSAGSILEIYGCNGGAATLYLHLFDSLTHPTTGAKPTLGRFVLPPASNFDIAFSSPRPFSLGLWVEVSTTFDTLTEDATSSVDLQASVL